MRVYACFTVAGHIFPNGHFLHLSTMAVFYTGNRWLIYFGMTPPMLAGGAQSEVAKGHHIINVILRQIPALVLIFWLAA